MEIFNKNVELQIDKKPMGRVIRVNVNGVCKVRICQIPEKYFPKETDESNLIDITLNEEKIREGRTRCGKCGKLIFTAFASQRCDCEAEQ